MGLSRLVRLHRVRAKVIDYDTWLDAVRCARKAAADLGSYETVWCLNFLFLELNRLFRRPPLFGTAVIHLAIRRLPSGSLDELKKEPFSCKTFASMNFFIFKKL